MTIQDFCDKHSVCQEGREWALANCKTMTDVWQTAKPEWLVWVATRKGVLSDLDLRLFACWSVRQVWDLLNDNRSRNAVEVAERFAEGKASREELYSAYYASRAAPDSVSSSVASAAANAAVFAATTAVYSVSGAYAKAAAGYAGEAYDSTVRNVSETAIEKQAAWLRKNTKPNLA